jgi:hypothetical protein
MKDCQGKIMREPKLILPANTTYADLVGKEVISADGYPGRITGYYPGINDDFPIWVQFFHNGDEEMYTRNGYLYGSDDYITLATITQPSLESFDWVG